MKSTPIATDEEGGKGYRFGFPNDQFFFKSQAEMGQVFHDLPESLDNTNLIVDKIEVLNLKKDILLPAFPIPPSFQIHKDANMNQWEFLKHLTYEGANRRYNDLTPDIQERIDF
jgi:DNA polymerase-3 subunit alpha